MSLRALYNFKESRFTSLSHEIRVFIYGADVTPWLKGDLSVTYGNRDSFNSIVLEISNPRKIWQITRDNLSGKWRQDVGEYSELEKLYVFKWKNNPYINPSFNLNVNAIVLGQQDKAGGQNPSIAGSNRYLPPPEGAERRFRFAVNDCIFSKNDPIRAFMKNPYSSERDEWVEIFCGFVQDHPITTNYVTGESSVRISGYCIRHLLTKMRVQVGHLVTPVDASPLFEQGFFSDFMKPGIAGHPQFSKSLEHAIKDLILGNPALRTGDVAEPNLGIGEFKMGNVICYNPNAPGTTLERWHLMTLFGVNKVAFPWSSKNDLWLTYSDMRKLGKSTIYLPDSYGQGPAGRYLHFLLPFEGTGAGSLTQSGPATGTLKTIEWTTRWEIIRDFASKLDFQVTTSPSGDILVEFPMYGFTPHVFTTKGGTEDNILFTDQFRGDGLAKENEKTLSKITDDIDKGVTPYGLGALLTFELHQIEETVNDEAEDFDTVLQVDGGISLQNAQAKQGEEANIALRAFCYSPMLVSRFGVIAGQMSIPHLGQRPSEQSGGAEGALGTRLVRLALIEYMKRMADASSWDGSVVFRPFLFPNRPVWLKRSGRMGVLTSVTNRWSIGKSASTSFAMNMLMSERYNPDTGKTEYRLPTGAANMPISYRSLWGETEELKDASDPNCGVLTKVGTKTPPDTVSNGSAGSVGSDEPAPEKATAKAIAAKSKTFDSNTMYTPFSEAIIQAIQLAKEKGLPPVSIKSTYRSPKTQQAMKRNPGEYGVKMIDGKYVPVGEPWKSMHQYGMAVDIKIEGERWSDYQKFADLCGPNIRWGGTFDDPIHYEWKIPGQSKGSYALDRWRRDMGYTADNYDAANYLKQAWAYVESLSGKPKGSVSTEQNPKEGRAQDQEQKWTAETPGSCRPSSLSQSGLNAMSDIIQKISSYT